MGAFWACTSLTNLTIPQNVFSIENSIIGYCDSLKTVQVAKENQTYHSAGNCIINTESKTLIAACNSSKLPTDGSVTIIGFAPFENCNKLTSITIPNTVTIIGDGAFWGCDAMTEITIPGSVTGIGLSAFGDRTAADVTGDGKVNLADAIRILKRANGNKDPFPAEK